MLGRRHPTPGAAVGSRGYRSPDVGTGGRVELRLERLEPALDRHHRVVDGQLDEGVRYEGADRGARFGGAVHRRLDDPGPLGHDIWGRSRLRENAGIRREDETPERRQDNDSDRPHLFVPL